MRVEPFIFMNPQAHFLSLKLTLAPTQLIHMAEHVT
jgi:hypothetical protein